MVIDSHQHFWKLGLFERSRQIPANSFMHRDFLPDDLKLCLEGVGVQATVVVQGPEQSVEETRWHLQLADRYPFIAGVVGWVDLPDPQVGRTLEDLWKHPKFKGIRYPSEFDSPGAIIGECL
jgi:L-fuconolactonase